MAGRRFIFGGIFTMMACMVVTMSVSANYDFEKIRTASAYDPLEFMFVVNHEPVLVHYLAILPEAPVLAERAGIDKIPEADRLFASHSQPGQMWRHAVDTYRHIDPGRRLFI